MTRIAVLLLAALLVGGCAGAAPSGPENEGTAAQKPDTIPEGTGQAAGGPGKLLRFEFSPGYSDMDGASHSGSLERNEAGEWVFVSRDRESIGEPFIVTTRAVSADAETRFEAFALESGILELADREDSDLFAMDFSPWSYTFVFDGTSGQGGWPVRYSLVQYREYSDADFALLAELDREIEAMCGEILSRAAEPDPF